MKRHIYGQKLQDNLNCLQLTKIENSFNSLTLKVEKDIKNPIPKATEQELLIAKNYSKLRTTEAQPARLYGLAKVHKNEIPLRPVLLIPGSSYHKLNKFLNQFLKTVVGANIETSTLDAREKFEKLLLAKIEKIVSLDVRSLYTNFSVSKAIEIAYRLL